MSPYKQIIQLVDAPLAIVVGSVGAVLIAIQLGAVGMVAQAQVDRAHERAIRHHYRHIAVARCMGATGVGGQSGCVAGQMELSYAVNDTHVTAIAVTSVVDGNALVAGDSGMVPVGYAYSP
ncbi:hypothetical protein [Xylophilus ampelinus]|uniref:Uncharacterized protein n=1 Tax=Xylophilus ampelinus TaxID=54067 RepID=A0A318STK9_9BURK|nr:hypothetical protein [Xylophilus ampelinus]MCS4510394.1 hypothetical protein [Xylophilus ampelinus]PYE77986.1 hypothetical protein DFQ15_11010 [Xylophilus ampelinus]